MKKLPLVLVTLSFIISISSFAQVAIGTDQLDESAILQLESNEKGFLLPRMTNEERLKIENPAVGLQVFVTDFGDNDKGMILFYDGTEWKAFKELSSRPDAPTSVKAEYNQGDAEATITFQPPSNHGGSTIISYTAISSPGNLIGTNSETTGDGTGSITVTGLQPDTFYTFTVTATNKIGTSLPSASSNVVPAPQLFDHLYGGVVFYIFQQADADYGFVEGETHGLICAPEDLNSTYKWISELYRDEVIDTKYIMGSGEQNTKSIIERIENGDTDYAAYQATLYHLSEDGDKRPWYLPSKDELNKMYDKRVRINEELSNINGSQFTDQFYWSSSQDSYDNKAWRQNLVRNIQGGDIKTNSYKVRPIRSF